MGDPQDAELRVEEDSIDRKRMNWVWIEGEGRSVSPSPDPGRGGTRARKSVKGLSADDALLADGPAVQKRRPGASLADSEAASHLRKV